MYHLNQKSIIQLVIQKKCVISILNSFFKVSCQVCRSKLIMNVVITNHINLLPYEENIYMGDSSQKENVSRVNFFLIIQSGGKTSESHETSVNMEFSPSHCNHVVSFSLSLGAERGQVLSNGNLSVNPGRLVDEHLLWWLNTFQRIKEDLKVLKRTYQMWQATLITDPPRTRSTILSILFKDIYIFFFFLLNLFFLTRDR